MYYDYETKNLNFVEMSKYLKGIGIGNHDFMLALHDESLVGVDPFDKGLSSYTQKKVIKECKENIWYFLREIVRIPYVGHSDRILSLNRATLAAAFLYSNGISSWITAPRMTEKDWMAAALATWDEVFGERLVGFTCPNINQARIHLSRSNQICSRMPDYIKNACSTKTAEAFSSHSNPKNTATPFKDKCAKYSTVVVSDAEFVKYINDYAKTMGSFRDLTVLYNSVISDDAKTNGALDVLAGTIPWDEKLYDTLSIQKITAMKKAPKKVVHINYDFSDLGLTDRERELRTIFAGMDGSADIYRRELDIKRLPEDEKYLASKKSKKKSSTTKKK